MGTRHGASPRHCGVASGEEMAKACEKPSIRARGRHYRIRANVFATDCELQAQFCVCPRRRSRVLEQRDTACMVEHRTRYVHLSGSSQLNTADNLHRGLGLRQREEPLRILEPPTPHTRLSQSHRLHHIRHASAALSIHYTGRVQLHEAHGRVTCVCKSRQDAMAHQPLLRIHPAGDNVRGRCGAGRGGDELPWRRAWRRSRWK